MNTLSSALIVFFSIVNVLYLKRATQSKKKRRDELLRPYMSEDSRADGGEIAWTELGDRHPDFRYAF